MNEMLMQMIQINRKSDAILYLIQSMIEEGRRVLKEETKAGERKQHG